MSLSIRIVQNIFHERRCGCNLTGAIKRRKSVRNRITLLPDFLDGEAIHQSCERIDVEWIPWRTAAKAPDSSIIEVVSRGNLIHNHWQSRREVLAELGGISEISDPVHALGKRSDVHRGEITGNLLPSYAAGKKDRLIYSRACKFREPVPPLSITHDQHVDTPAMRCQGGLHQLMPVTIPISLAPDQGSGNAEDDRISRDPEFLAHS